MVTLGVGVGGVEVDGHQHQTGAQEEQLVHLRRNTHTRGSAKTEV